jgi:hypothetical protein
VLLTHSADLDTSLFSLWVAVCNQPYTNTADTGLLYVSGYDYSTPQDLQYQTDSQYSVQTSSSPHFLALHLTIRCVVVYVCAVHDILFVGAVCSVVGVDQPFVVQLSVQSTRSAHCHQLLRVCRRSARRCASEWRAAGRHTQVSVLAQL